MVRVPKAVSHRPRRRYGSFGTTADVGIWATAPTTSELYDALGMAMFAVMTDLRSVRPVEERAVSASGEDPGSLAVAFLNELVVLAGDGFLVREVLARPLGSPPTALLATVRGEIFDPTRHTRRVEVKAVTLHQLEVDLARGRATVILDI
ncbi:MAG: archease [Thermoplasmata archaeon]|nr:archease [Thermoplasmata archaeon]